MYDGIIFDMDGTLWDSAQNVAKSWNLAVGEERFTEADIKGVMGMTMDRIAEKFFPEKSEKERGELLGRCCVIENDYLREHGGYIYPDAESTLSALSKSYKLFIVSNCQAGYIEAFLDYYGLWELFSDKLCWGDNNLEKSENIRLIIERNGLSNAIYVGDTQGDCDSAYKAGAAFAHAAYGFGTVSRCDLSLNSLSELLEKLG